MSNPGHIDSILSTLFNECSIAAADVAKEACGMWEQPGVKSFEHRVQPIGRYETERLEKFEFIDLVQVNMQHELIAFGDVNLVLARHDKRRDLPVGLYAVFNHDMMLQLATFAPRPSGQCSYVQIGQEIDEDMQVALEGSSRTGQVEAIRTLVKHRTSSDLVQQLVASELETYAGNVEQALMPAAARLAYKYSMSQPSETRRVWVRNEEGTLEHTQIHGAPITVVQPGEADDIHGHNVGLLLGREQKTETSHRVKKSHFGKKQIVSEQEQVITGAVKLVAIVRGNMGFQLASFDQETGKVCLGEYDNPANPPALVSMIETLSRTDSDRVKLKDAKRAFTTGNKGPWLQWKRDIDNKTRFFRAHSLTPQLAGLHVGTAYNWNAFMDASKSEYSSVDSRMSPSKRMFNTFLRARGVYQFIERLGVNQKMIDFIDHGDSIQEEVIGQILGRVSLLTDTQGNPVADDFKTTYKGVLKDKKAGKTTTDVDTTVTLSRGKTAVGVYVDGKPSALEGVMPVTLFDEQLRLDSKNIIDKEKLEEILEVIGHICIKNS